MINNLLLLPPGLLSIIASIFLIFIPKNIIKLSSIIFSSLIIFYALNLKYIPTIKFDLSEYKLLLFSSHYSYSYIFTIAFSIALFIGIIFGISLKNLNKTQLSASFLYAGASISLVNAGDYISFYFFNELMSIAASIIIVSNKNNLSIKTGINYLKSHLLSGVLILGGISFIISSQGDINIVDLSNLKNESYVAYILLLSGILINCGMPPFSSWLTNGYSNAGTFGSVILPSFTTKAAIFCLIRFFSGDSILIYLGLFMIFYGIIYAILENNIYKILSYSVINQVGFMIVAVGVGSKLAIAGAASHAFCHIFYKILFFIVASIVVIYTKTSRCSDYYNLANKMKFTCFGSIIAALSISAFPFTSGFISKSIILSAAQQEHIWLYIMLVIASAGVFLHAGIKFPYVVFFAKDKNNEQNLREKNFVKEEFNFFRFSSMIISSIICIIIGIFPEIIFKMLPSDIKNISNPNNFNYIIHQLELLLSSALAFYLLLPYLKTKNIINLDFDWFNIIFFARIKKIIVKIALYNDKLLLNLVNIIYKSKTIRTYIILLKNHTKAINISEVVLIIVIIMTLCIIKTNI